MKYRVVWQIELEKEVTADSKEDAVIQVENLDCQHDGSYVADSFELRKVEEIKDEKRKPILYIDENEFVGWYFDKDTRISVIEQVMNGETVNLQTLLENVGYLPLRLVKNPEDLFEEDRKYAREEKEIEDPGTRYKLKLRKEAPDERS